MSFAYVLICFFYITGAVDGIRAMQFTVGVEEEEVMKKQNELLKKRGLPFFKKLDKSFGE